MYAPYGSIQATRLELKPKVKTKQPMILYKTHYAYIMQINNCIRPPVGADLSCTRFIVHMAD